MIIFNVYEDLCHALHKINGKKNIYHRAVSTT